MDSHPEDLMSDRVPWKVRHREFQRYSVDELLGLWEVSVNCEVAWNSVVTALRPVMEDMYQMQAVSDTKFQRRRGKNSERRQRLKGRRAAMLTMSESRQDADSDDAAEENNEDFSNRHESNAQVLDENHAVRIQKGPLKGPFKSRQYRYDNDEYVESFQPQAFAVDGEPDFESGDPQDGWEYLRRVIWETARCPKVVVADIDPGKLVAEQTPYMPEIPAIPSCPPELLPSKEWESSYLDDFTELRKELSRLYAPAEPSSGRLPSVRDKAAWEILCFGIVRSTQAEDVEESVAVNVEANCGVSPGQEEINAAAEVGFHAAPLTETSDTLTSGETLGMDKVSVSVLVDESKGHSAGIGAEDFDSIHTETQVGTAVEHLHATEPSEADAGEEDPQTHTLRVPDSSEDHSLLHKYECRSEVIADLWVSRTIPERDLSDRSEFEEIQEDHVEKAVLCPGNMASSDIRCAEASLLETTGIKVNLEEEAEEPQKISSVTVLSVSCVDASYGAEKPCRHDGATEFADTLRAWSVSSVGGIDNFTHEGTFKSSDFLYESVDQRGDGATYVQQAESYDFDAYADEAPEFEDDDLRTADLVECVAGVEIFNAKNLLEEFEDEDHESIADIDMSVQQLFTRVFRIDKAWELPLIHTLLRLDVVSRATLFRHHVSWLDSVEDLPQERALWLLGLAAVVDTPLNGDTTAAFRALLRYCAGVRASKKTRNNEEFHMLNALITVAGLYFGQAEVEST